MIELGTVGWTDSHCHLQDFPAEELSTILKRAEIFKIERFCVNGTRPEDWSVVARLAANFPGVYPQFGLHPWQTAQTENWEIKLKEFLLRHPHAGVGEIGLDTQLTDTPLETQRPAFQKQLALAAELQRPCTIHAVGAVWDELLEDLQTHRPRAALLHAWGGGTHMLPRWIECNAYFSFGGALCREPQSGKLVEAVQAIPLDRILLETDSPWQHPKGKAHRQEPAALLSVAEQVAKIKKVSLDLLRQVVEKNVTRCFGHRQLGHG
ncbi:MAG: TatD family hydrolase [Verrucomicrobia bacterium]|nr:TatD family hydrolase [Verrucomicrobiota bacterium]MCH8513085.1 TatD family hydrolase [Kiritimatiellia bacterium]